MIGKSAGRNPRDSWWRIAVEMIDRLKLSCRPSQPVHALVDALGNPIDFLLTDGEAHDLEGADRLLPTIEADTLIADKACPRAKRGAFDVGVLEPLAAAGETRRDPSGPRCETTTEGSMRRAI